VDRLRCALAAGAAHGSAVGRSPLANARRAVRVGPPVFIDPEESGCVADR
jgi:hypothetical protein